MLVEKRRDRFDGHRPAREPIFNIPDVLTIYVAIMVAIQALRSWVLTTDQDRWLMFLGAFIPARYQHPVTGQDPVGYFGGPVAYSLLHGGWAHLLSNSLFLVIFATPLAARIGAARFTLLWILSAVFSAFFLAVFSGFEDSYLVGASGVVSAMAGASCRFVVPLLGSDRMRAGRYAPRLGILEAMTQRSVVVFVALWLLFNVVLAGVDSSQNIAWQAHLGGFLFGYLTFSLFDPPLRH